MLQKALAGFALAIFACSTCYAQCDCADCSSTATETIGIDYNEYDAGQYDASSSCGCGSSDCQSNSYQSDSCESDCYGVTDRCDCQPKCLYISGFGGWNGLQDFQQNDIFDNSIDAISGSFDDGSIYGLAIGSQVHQRIRYELEASIRENDADSWLVQTFVDGAVTASALAPATAGTLRSKSGMVNLLFDVQPRQAHCWNSYVGGGLGITSVSGTIVAGDTYEIDDESFALQAIAGVNKGLSKKLDLFAEYRFFWAGQVEVVNTTAGLGLGNFEYSTNSVVFGLRIRR